MEIEKRVILIVGLGNDLAGDDGVGLKVIEGLRRIKLPDHVTLLSAGVNSLDILDHLEGVRLLIYVDACDWGGQPGEWFVSEAESLTPKSREIRFSLHQPSLFEVLTLAKAMGVNVRTVVVGVQPMNLAMKQELSPPVNQSVNKIIRAIEELIAEESRTKLTRF